MNVDCGVRKRCSPFLETQNNIALLERALHPKGTWRAIAAKGRSYR